MWIPKPSVVTCALLAHAAFADNVVSVPLVAIERDRSQVSSWVRPRLGPLADVDVGLRNIDVAYVMNITVGTPPQLFTLLMDTGSSATWVTAAGCGRSCGFPRHAFNATASSTATETELAFGITYGLGYAQGMYIKDTVGLNGVMIPNANIAVSVENYDRLMYDADGIFGAGPDNLNKYTNPQQEAMQTVISTMAAENIISHNMFSIYFEPYKIHSLDNRLNGEIVFGGVKPEYAQNDAVKYVPLTTNSQFKDYWAVDVSAITVGTLNKTYDQGAAALVDTGTTLVCLPSDIIKSTFANVRGAFRNTVGQYMVPCHTKELPDITITMGGNDYVLRPEDYVMQRTNLLSFPPNYCSTFLYESPPYLDIILGYGFLLQYVSVYDVENQRIGFAKNIQT